MSRRKQSIHRTSGNLVFDQKNVVRHFVPKTKDNQKSSIAKRVEARRAGKKADESPETKKPEEEDGSSAAARIQDRKDKAGAKNAEALPKSYDPEHQDPVADFALNEELRKGNAAFGGKKKLSFSDILELIREEGRQAKVNNRRAHHTVKQFVLDWDSNAPWVEWQFSGYQSWGGEQPDEYFWTPTGHDGKLAFTTEPLEELYDITQLTDKSKTSGHFRVTVLSSFYGVQLKEDPKTYFEIEVELVSRLDAPNKVQIMIRCPVDKKSIVEPCINKDFIFSGHWKTKYAEYTLRKPTRYTEEYISN